MKKRVLLIEDDTKLTTLLTEFLSGHDFAVTVANHPRQGLRLVTQESWDLLVLDVMLPEINGFDLWRLTGFAGKWLKNYGFTSEQAVKSAFQSAIESGEIVPSAYILHYMAPNAA